MKNYKRAKVLICSMFLANVNTIIDGLYIQEQRDVVLKCEEVAISGLLTFNKKFCYNIYKEMRKRSFPK